jgi:hypothetical protein
MQFGQGKPPVGVVFDSDMGKTIDDALALALLYGLQGKGESRVISVSVTKPSLRAAVFADCLVRFYTGEPGPFGVPTPIGLATRGKMAEDTPMIAAVVDRPGAEGKPAYNRSIEKMNDTADPVAVIRNALSAQFDQNAIVLLTGPATNLAAVLDLPGSRELIEKKVRYLVAGAGAYQTSQPEGAIQCDVQAARKLFAEWPTPIVACGVEVGEALPFPGASIDKDFAFVPAHPVADAYRASHPMPFDAPSHAMAAALYAVRPNGEYFRLSDAGTIEVLDGARTRLVPSANGRHKYLMADPAQKEKVLQAYVELASTKPIPRPQRFRPPQKKQ